MPQKVIAGQTVEVDAEGYLTRPEQWNRAVGEALAQELGLTLTDAHWRILEFMQRDFRERGSVPGMRRLNKVGGFATKDLYALFPDGPIKKAALLAGLPKPASCV